MTPELVIDTLETSIDSTSVLNQFHPELYSGFFAGSQFLHPELTCQTWGESSAPVPYQMSQDDVVTAILLICAAILIFSFNKIRTLLSRQTRNFLLQPREHTGLFAVETSIEAHSRMFMVMVLSAMGGVAMMGYSQAQFNVEQHIITPHLLLAVYSVSFLLMFTMRRIMTGFVNWVFFPKSQQKIWKDTYSYLISIEAIAFFPLLLIFVYFGLSFEKSITFFIIILLIIKILLSFKAYQIFFNKSYCAFHLFAYLCALEIMPLLALCKLLAIVTETLVVKY